MKSAAPGGRRYSVTAARSGPAARTLIVVERGAFGQAVASPPEMAGGRAVRPVSVTPVGEPVGWATETSSVMPPGLAAAVEAPQPAIGRLVGSPWTARTA